MSYETRQLEEQRYQRYEGLKNRKAQIEQMVATWVADASNLHTDSPIVGEKDDVVALRDDFILQLRTRLGV